MSARTWPHLLTTLLAGHDLAAEDTAWAMRQVMADDVEPVALAGFLIALRAKGETVAELTGLVEAILAEARRPPVGDDAVDVVGTGGDQANTVNISTMAAIVVAGTGIPVIKHGGRAASSSSGSADVLEELGIRLDLPAGDVARCLTEARICYLFAPRWHAGLRHAAPVRRTLGVPTAINYVAPLVNPAQPRAGCFGCSNLDLAPALAQILADRGCSALVVRGEDGLDEITTATRTRVWTVTGGHVSASILDTLDLGVPRSAPGDLRGGDADHNAAVVDQVISGEKGPVRDAVLVNAAAAIASYRGLTGGLHDAMMSGLREAEHAIDSGAAERALQRWARVSSSAHE